jgi:hypothetical protein
LILIITDLRMPKLDGHGLFAERDRRQITTPGSVMSTTLPGDLAGHRIAESPLSRTAASQYTADTADDRDVSPQGVGGRISFAQ